MGSCLRATWNYHPQSWQWADLRDEERIAEAKRLYSEAGYTLTKPIWIRLLFNANIAIKQTAILIAAMWKETLGIETELTEEEYRDFLQSRHDKSRWEVARLGWIADFNDASIFLDAFREKSPNSDAGMQIGPLMPSSTRLRAHLIPIQEGSYLRQPNA